VEDFSLDLQWPIAMGKEKQREVVLIAEVSRRQRETKYECGILEANMAEWVHTFKGAVLASEYDFASHMNSHMYVSRFDQATWFLLHAIGVTPASIKQQDLRVAIVRQNYQFLEELRGGELVEIKSGFLAVGEKYFRFLHQMYDDESGKMVATCDSVAVQASMESGKSVPLTASLQEKAKRYLVTSNVPADSQVG
jgi:acyl-CoA thioester hydrolase